MSTLNVPQNVNKSRIRMKNYLEKGRIQCFLKDYEQSPLAVEGLDCE